MRPTNPGGNSGDNTGGYPQYPQPPLPSPHLMLHGTASSEQTNYGGREILAPSNMGQARPSIEEMMSNSTGTYQGLIGSIQEYEDVKKAYLSINDEEFVRCDDFPRSRDGQQQLVKSMMEAALDCTDIYEPENAKSVEKIQEKAYRDIEWELVLWPLLHAIEAAQCGKCQVPSYLSTSMVARQKYNSFMERFNSVLEALRLSKDISVSLFKHSMFTHRLARRPQAELYTKWRNRKSNGEKSTQISIGIRAAAQNDIRPNENGELEDRYGRYHGKSKVETAQLKDSLAKSRKRKRKSDREAFTRQMQGNNDTTTQAPYPTFEPGGMVPQPQPPRHEQAFTMEHGNPMGYAMNTTQGYSISDFPDPRQHGYTPSSFTSPMDHRSTSIQAPGMNLVNNPLGEQQYTHMPGSYANRIATDQVPPRQFEGPEMSSLQGRGSGNPNFNPTLGPYPHYQSQAIEASGNGYHGLASHGSLPHSGYETRILSRGEPNNAFVPPNPGAETYQDHPFLDPDAVFGAQPTPNVFSPSNDNGVTPAGESSPTFSYTSDDCFSSSSED